jgi:signal transduction histidine kinase
MVTLSETGLAGITALFGIMLCGLGIYTSRRWNEPGAASFGAVAVILGLGGIGSSLVVFVRGVAAAPSTAPLWYSIGYSAWVLSTVPWIMFTLQYTGRVTEFRWRQVAILAAPVFGFLIVETTSLTVDSLVGQIFGTISILYAFSILGIGSYLLLRTTSNYGHLSLYIGLSLTLAQVSTLLTATLTGSIVSDTVDLTAYALYATGFILPTAGFGLGLFRYRMFDSTPAVGALGERAIPRETNDIVFVVDNAERIIKLNQTAVETFEVSSVGPLGDPLESVLKHPVAQLTELETVELETTAGKRKFDAQVTSFTDQHGQRLGTLLSLRDVTNRELRKQRLEVLNRVLRHNLRNGVDIIKANTQAITDDVDDQYTQEIHDTVDRLTALSTKARATDQILSQPGQTSQRDLSSVLSEVVDDEQIDLDLPAHAPLHTNWDALRAAIAATIENASEHAREAVSVRVTESRDGYTITVADDGPGIPESELAALKAETETQYQHGTGLGLWQLKWGVTKVGGELSFDTTDGTTVQITVPNQAADSVGHGS